MDFWLKAKTLAEEAAKKSQAFADTTKISDLISDTAKKSQAFAAEASKITADQIKSAAMQQADNLRFLSLSAAQSSSSSSSPASNDFSSAEIERLGVTDDLREFVKGLTSTTFQNFPVHDEEEASDVQTISNVRQDLTEWQAKHATVVLTTVKEISRLRYELCPRYMKEWKFWRIYFTLVSSHVAPYEKQYIEDIKFKEASHKKYEEVKPNSSFEESFKGQEANLKSKTSLSEQDLDSFLLGDLEDDDDAPDDGDSDLGDDFDKADDSDIEDVRQMKETAAVKG